MKPGQVVIARLYQKRSAKDRVYFFGRIGAVKLLLLRDERAVLADGDDPVWNLVVASNDEPKRGAKRKVAHLGSLVGDGRNA